MSARARAAALYLWCSSASGTGDLAGIKGAMTIDAADNHAYVPTYALPGS